MSEIPPGWSTAPIGELISLNPKNECDDRVEVGFVPMSLLGTEFRSVIGFERRSWGKVKKGYTHFVEGDVLLAKITPCFENGKAGIVTNLPNCLGAGSTEFFVCRSQTEALLPKYLLAYFKTQNFLHAGEVEMTGSVGHKRVPKAYLIESEIPLAPLNEQKRIADKLDALLARVDACRERLDRVPLILKRFRQAVLAAATSGKLTEEWREHHIAGMQPRTESGIVSPTDHTSDHPDYDNLPKPWVWMSVEEVCSVIVDCPHSTPKWSDSGEICLRTTNFRPGFLDLSEVHYVSPEVYQRRIARLEPRPGDVIYSREGGILGIACIIPPGMKVCLGQRMMLICTDSNVYLSTLLMHVLNSPMILSRVRRLTGGTASPHLNVRDIKDFPVPVPPIEEQHEIVRRVETLLAFADRLEARYKTARAHIERLTPALLAKAFRGELVPQDPNDEPASVLLERIRAGRAVQPRAKRRNTCQRAQD